MFVFVVVNVLLALNAGLVHNAAIVQESCQEQSIQASEQSYREVETGCGSVVESSSKSVSQSSSSSSSSSSLSGSSLSSYKSLIEQCKYLKNQEWYYQYLELYGNDCMMYIQPIFDNLNCNKPCFDDWKYMQQIEKLRAIYEILNSNGIFDINCDLQTKRQFIEQAKCQLREILSNIPKSCFLHKPLSYICDDTCDISYFPFIYGLCNGLFESQYPFYSTSSTSVSSTSTRSISSSSSSSKFDISPYKSIIEQCQYLKNQEWYYRYLELYGNDCMMYIQPIFDNLNCNKPCFGDWEYMQHIEKLRAVYEILNSNGIFDINCDLQTKRQFIEQAKCQLREILSNIPNSCFLHKPLSYICDDTCDVNYFPLIYGLCNGLFDSQYPLYSTSSSSTSVSSTSTRSVSSASSSKFDISPYKSIIEQCQYLKNQEWYYRYLEQYGNDCMMYIQPIFDNLNCNKPCFGDWEYMQHIEKLRAIYEILNGNGIFDINCDLQTKRQFIEQAKCQLREILSNIPNSCFLHKPLSYICDDTCDVNYFPLIYGLCNGLFDSQYSYYSSSSSSSTTSTSSSSSGCVQQTETCSSASSTSCSNVVC